MDNITSPCRLHLRKLWKKNTSVLPEIFFYHSKKSSHTHPKPQCNERKLELIYKLRCV